jgi:hypothetical protein
MSDNRLSGRLDFPQEGFALFWDNAGLHIEVIDYHAEVLHLTWDTLLDLARRAGHGAPLSSSPGEGQAQQS